METIYTKLWSKSLAEAEQILNLYGRIESKPNKSDIARLIFQDLCAREREAQATTKILPILPTLPSQTPKDNFTADIEQINKEAQEKAEAARKEQEEKQRIEAQKKAEKEALLLRLKELELSQ